MPDKKSPQILGSENVLSQLPLDVARCTGSIGFDWTETRCVLRDTCRRYQALLSMNVVDYVPLMMRTDDNGSCDYYLSVDTPSGADYTTDHEK